MGRVRGAAAVGVLVLTVLAAGFLQYTRNFPATFDKPAETFAFGPVVGSMFQEFTTPVPYISQISVPLRSAGEDGKGVGVNLRLMTDAGDVIASAQSRVFRTAIVTATGESFSRRVLSFPARASGGERLRLEIQRADGGAGDLLVPLQVGPARLDGILFDHDGQAHNNWSTLIDLEQTNRPLTYLRNLFSSDPLTAAGVLAAVGLVAFSVFVIIGRVLVGTENISRFIVAVSWGMAVAVAVSWLSYALVPVT
ncbi:MAG: hypothetical protein CL790_04870 [Chloroflexi bacterium]|nr:hypothetical protein [Chloroflexota bacterium]HCU73651.1 hypothetical protein [Chloroflexota bacterium]